MTTFEVLKQYFKCFDIKGSAVNPLRCIKKPDKHEAGIFRKIIKAVHYFHL